MTDLKQERQRLSDEAIERNFEAAWELVSLVGTDCGWPPNERQKKQCRAWYMLGYIAAQSGVGAGLAMVETTRIPTE